MIRTEALHGCFINPCIHLPMEDSMSKTTFPFPLRKLLLVDAATCAGFGLLLTAGAQLAGPLMQIPVALLFYVGLSLFPIAVFMAIVATRSAIHPAGAWVIIAGNVLWAGASFLLLAGDWIAPNLLGSSFIVAQALVVAVLAKLEHAALGDAVLRPA
ncbi:MAG: hypothetical protein U5R46_15185 [Gammaproteobacteria bacterium]|nr:hypothetical protein [Gammaproteobacteria bacterium]